MRLLLVIAWLLCTLPASADRVDSLLNAPATAETAETWNRLGKEYREHSAYYKAIECHKAALAIAEHLGDNPSMIESLNSMGVAYRRLDESYLAMDVHMRALLMAEKEGDLRHMAYSLNSIGNIHITVGEYPKAIACLRRALAIEITRDNLLGQAMNLNNIGEAYFLSHVPDSAEVYYTRSLEANERIGMHMGVAINYNSLGAVYMERGEYDRALDLFNRAREINERIEDRVHLGATYNYLGSAYEAKGRLHDALEWYRKAIALNGEIGSKWNLCTSYTGISKLYRRMGDFEQALDYYTRYAELNAEMIGERNKRYVEEMQVKYETSEKESLIASLTTSRSRNRVVIWSTLGLLAISSIFICFAVSNMRQKRRLAEQRLIEAEQRRRLDASRSLIEGEMGERMRLAREIHDGLGSMLSVVKFNLASIFKKNCKGTGKDPESLAAMEMIDEAIRELRRIAHSLMPESLLRYGLKVSLTDFCNAISGVHFHYYGTENRLDGQLEMVIYRIAQELVNNALKHSGAEAINVQLMVETDRVCLTVQDDGCGFDTGKATGGFGLGSIRNRASTFNGRFNIISAPGRGTEASVEFDV